MRHFASPSFWTCFFALPQHIQNLAQKNYRLLKQEPRHPSLHYKRIGKYYSVRVGLKYRALAVDIDEGVLWFWIGSHTDYDKLTK